MSVPALLLASILSVQSVGNERRVFDPAFWSTSPCGLRSLLDERPVSFRALGINGQSLLHHAVLMGCPDMVKLVLERGADVDTRDDSGATALHIAAIRSDLHSAKLLIEHGANVNIRDENDSTPLHWAAQTEALPIIELLKAGGAEVGSVDSCGRVPQGVESSEALKKSLLVGSAHSDCFATGKLGLDEFCDEERKAIANGKGCKDLATQIVRTPHLWRQDPSLESVVAQVRALLTPRGVLEIDPATGRMIVTDEPARVRSAALFVIQLDMRAECGR